MKRVMIQGAGSNVGKSMLFNKLTGKRMAPHELAGLMLVMLGVGLLLWSVAA